MSSIKLQSLIRKFKNSTKEQTDKNKIIKNFQHDLSLVDALSTTYLFQSINTHLHKYTLTEEIVTKNTSDFSENIINDYIGNGYLNNVFNTELCNQTWLINMYMINNIHDNFIVNNNVNIKSLHIADICELSAFNHYLLNGALPELVNSEWQWLNIVTNNTNATYTTKDIQQKYATNLLQLLGNNIYSVNNINYVINEVTNKFSKINFLCNNNVNICSNNIDYLCNNKDTTSDIHNYLHITNAIFVIKLLDVNGLFLIKIPNKAHWDTAFINSLLLYCLLFNEVYIFNFDLITNVTYLLCKGKKKINNETIYKKLIHIILNKDYINAHLFSKDIFVVPSVAEWLSNILQIKNTPQVLNIVFNDVLIIINATLKINKDIFL